MNQNKTMTLLISGFLSIVVLIAIVSIGSAIANRPVVIPPTPTQMPPTAIPPTPSPTPVPVTMITVYADNTIAEFIQGSAKKYEQTHPNTKIVVMSEDTNVTLGKFDKEVFKPFGSDVDPSTITDEMRSSLKNFPTVWIPMERSAIYLANSTVSSRVGYDPFTDDGIYRSHPVALSVAVIFGLKDRTDQLETSFGDVNWTTIQKAASNSQGWTGFCVAADGTNPCSGWGYLKPIIPNPLKTSVGVQAISSIGGEYFNTNALDTTKMDDPQFREFLKSIFENSTTLANGTNAIEDFALFGASAGDIGTALESQILPKIAEIKARHDLDVSIYYPQKVSYADYPYTTWVGPETSFEQKELALDFYKFLVADEQQKQLLTIGFRPVSAIKVDTQIDGNLFTANYLGDKSGSVKFIIDRSEQMRSLDRDTLTTLLTWYRKEVLK